MHLLKGSATNTSKAQFGTSLREYSSSASKPELGITSTPAKRFILTPFRAHKDSNSIFSVNPEQITIAPVQFLPPMRPTSAAHLNKMPFVQRYQAQQLKIGATELVSSLYDFD